MKTIPNYFIGVLDSGIPVYCNVMETVLQGKFIPFYTSKRRVKNHNELVDCPNNFFNLNKLDEFIKEEYKVPKEIMLGFVNGKLSIFRDGEYPLSNPAQITHCPFMNCSQVIIIHSPGFTTCPHCNKAFIPE